MHIVVVGVDHTTASLATRERLACTSRLQSQILSDLQQSTQECALLSTCNRLELYAVCEEVAQGRAALLQVLSESRQVARIVG